MTVVVPALMIYALSFTRLFPVSSYTPIETVLTFSDEDPSFALTVIIKSAVFPILLLTKLSNSSYLTVTVFVPADVVSNPL